MSPPSSVVRLGVVVAALLAGGCGRGAAPFVDPRPLVDGGLVERTPFEASPGVTDGGGGADGGGSDVASAGGAGAGGVGGVAGAGGAAGAAGAAGAGGGADAAVVPTTLDLSITDPADNDLRVARGRFAPGVTIAVHAAPGASDDVSAVVVELWSTGASAAKQSATALALLSKVTGAGGAGGAGGAAGGGGGSSGEATFTYGDTPIDLAALTTAVYELRATATTVTGATGAARRTFRVDAGPVIHVLSPTPNQAARGSVVVRIEVTDPFDTTGTPPTVTASVANIALAGFAVTGSLYQVTVPETIASPPLSGPQLLDVGATNAAGVAAASVGVPFVFDDLGPAIASTRPATGALIGGIVKLEADVTDPAGVDSGTVIAVVAHGADAFEVHLDRDAANPKHFSHLFDTRRLSASVLYPTVSFRASDLPGNQSAVGYTVAIDNTPPLAELDPAPDLRVRRYVNGNWRCSWELDPLGADAVNDGDRVLQLFDVRARVEDQGNSPAAGGADVTPLARLDPARVELLVLDDTDSALVVDSDADGVCDAVNPRLVPTTNPMSATDALLVNMAPVPPTGAANFTPDPSIPSGGLPDCGIGDDSLLPPTLCRTSDLSIAIPARQSSDAAIWAIPNVLPGTALCVGNQLDALGNHLGDGPACIAVRAYDSLGNSQVSAVMHVCIDHDGDGVECPYAAIAGVSGGTPIRVTAAAPHGLATGDRALVTGVGALYAAAGLWTVTVVDATTFTLDGSTAPAASLVSGGARFMRWTSASDCTGTQRSLDPILVDDAAPCRPWRRYARGEHLDLP